MAKLQKLYTTDHHTMDTVRALIGEDAANREYLISTKAVKCENCGAVHNEDDVEAIRDMTERLGTGGFAMPLPVGECNATPDNDDDTCGSLVYGFDDLLAVDLQEIVAKYALETAQLSTDLDPSVFKNSLIEARYGAARAIEEAIAKGEKEVHEAEVLIAKGKHWADDEGDDDERREEEPTDERIREGLGLPPLEHDDTPSLDEHPQEIFRRGEFG